MNFNSGDKELTRALRGKPTRVREWSIRGPPSWVKGDSTLLTFSPFLALASASATTSLVGRASSCRAFSIGYLLEYFYKNSIFYKTHFCLTDSLTSVSLSVRGRSIFKITYS